MIIYKQAPIGDIDEKTGIVKGYGSIFDNKDSDDDVIERGAYSRTLKENGHRVKYIYQHDITKPLGRMKELGEDEKGLYFVAEVPKTTLGKDVLELIKYGVITENSVGIMPTIKDYSEEKNVRYIKEAKLYEISAVTLAANEEAIINEIKNKKMGPEAYQKGLKKYASNLKSLIRDGQISEETGYLLEYELQKLEDNINFEKTTETNVTLPDEKLSVNEVYKFLYNRLGNKS
tara:strand:+ start:715 stop:1410 length:696 start_codon:yes stop_codon:yes gene_type:complete